MTTHDGVVRFEYYDNEESEVRGDNKRVILLRNCTGCIETSEFKSKPFAFQFSTQQGKPTKHALYKRNLPALVISLACVRCI